MDRARLGADPTTASPSGRSAVRIRPSASSGCSSSSGTAPASPSRRTLIGRKKVSGAPLGLTDEFADPDYAEDPDGKRIPAGRPHPAGQPPHAGDRTEPDPAPRVQLLARLRRRGPTRPGPGVHRLPAQPAEGLPDRAEPAQGRAARGVHHAGRRRVLLRAARGYGCRPVPRRSAASTDRYPASAAFAARTASSSYSSASTPFALTASSVATSSGRRLGHLNR